jgi:hypothetical protein
MYICYLFFYELIIQAHPHASNPSKGFSADAAGLSFGTGRVVGLYVV